MLWKRMLSNNDVGETEGGDKTNDAQAYVGG
jgi:hypothetical protein